jgi:RHS repeat-associated protein
VGSLGNQSPFQHVLRDHLGSVDTLMDAKTGAVLQHRGYDVFGRPRDIASGNTLLSGTNWQGVTKGYTNHEHLIDQELIHMNGRIYDFNIGRFLSVDPFLQFPENSQSANPYSYILNNPMSGTDPTGYSCAGSNLESVCDSYYKDNGIVTESMKLTNMVSQTLNNSTSKTSSGQANKLQMAQSGGAGKQESKDVGLQTPASKSGTNVGGGLSGTFNEVANFGDWLVNHANDQLSQDESWRGDVWNFFAEDGINAFNQFSDGELMTGATSLDMALLKPLKAGDKLVDSYYNLQKAGRKGAHHIIQDAAARDLPSYRKADGPSVQLRGPSTNKWSPHYIATQVQRQRGGGTYASERRIGYKALRKSGMSKTDTRTAISEADKHFQSIGVTPSTMMRIPGNRR